jgi:hypothetical protein
MTRAEALAFLDAQWREEEYKWGIHRGGNEVFASMVVYGECTILGRTVHVTFDWPDEKFAADVRSLALKVLEHAHSEGRQMEPPS